MGEPSHDTRRPLRISARALRIRLASVRAVRASRWGFLGSCLSVADILAVLAEHLRLADAGRETPDDDRLVLSKGHAAPALYAAVNEWPGEGSYAALGSSYQGHPNLSFLPGVGVTSGSLGLAVPAAAGLAQGMSLLGGTGRVAVVLGDGELQSGIALEGILWAVRAGLRNVLFVVDANGFQSGGATPGGDVTRRMLEAAVPAFTAVDGHDTAELDRAIGRSFREAAGPALVWATTVRGKGMAAVEEMPVPMSWIPDDAVLAAAEEDLTEALRRADDRLARPAAEQTVSGRSS